MKENQNYSKEIMKHFFKPKNVGEIKNPDAIGEVGNLVCGDIMKLYMKIKNGKIVDASFRTFGCIVAIANTSVLTTMIKGKTLKRALKITKEDMIKKLGKPLPPNKIHCSVLAVDALDEAIYDYYKKNNIKIPNELEKKHNIIQKQKEEIERKFKNYVDMERKQLH